MRKRWHLPVLLITRRRLTGTISAANEEGLDADADDVDVGDAPLGPSSFGAPAV